MYRRTRVCLSRIPETGRDLPFQGVVAAMNVDDDFFRWVLVVGVLILLPIGAYHRIRSQMTGQPLDRRQEGLLILIGLRFVALLHLLGVLAFLINPAWMAWSSLPLPVWLRWAGVGFGVATIALITWTFRTLGKNLTDTVVTRREHALVTGGPYRWVR